MQKLAKLTAISIGFMAILTLCYAMSTWRYSNTVTTTISELQFTLNELPNGILYQTLTYTGTLQWSNGTTINNAQVTLQKYNAPLAIWIDLNTSMTDAYGNYAIEWYANETGTHQIRATWLQP